MSRFQMEHTTAVQRWLRPNAVYCVVNSKHQSEGRGEVGWGGAGDDNTSNAHTLRKKLFDFSSSRTLSWFLRTVVPTMVKTMNILSWQLTQRRHLASSARSTLRGRSLWKMVGLTKGKSHGRSGTHVLLQLVRHQSWHQRALVRRRRVMTGKTMLVVGSN